jgi:hypothetical protein
VAADVEAEPFIGAGTRNAAHVNRVGFEHGYIDIVLGEQIAGGQTRRSGTDNGDFCSHFILCDPISAREIPDVPALYAQPGSANQRHCRRPKCPHPHRRRAKLTQKIQKR